MRICSCFQKSNLTQHIECRKCFPHYHKMTRSACENTKKYIVICIHLYSKQFVQKTYFLNISTKCPYCILIIDGMLQYTILVKICTEMHYYLKFLFHFLIEAANLPSAIIISAISFAVYYSTFIIVYIFLGRCFCVNVNNLLHIDLSR